MTPFSGRVPVIGDKIYVDLGDSLIYGGELIGWVSYISSDIIILSDSQGRIRDSFHPENALDIEILEG